MQDQISKLFYETFQKEFTFLVSDYGFKGPYFDHPPYLYEVWYEAKNIAIEHSLDWKDQAIDFYISRLVNGNRPDGYLFNDQSERIRLRFINWILDKGVKDLHFPKITGLSFQEQIPIQIHNYARILQQYGQIFLEDKLDEFLKDEPGKKLW